MFIVWGTLFHDFWFRQRWYIKVWNCKNDEQEIQNGKWRKYSPASRMCPVITCTCDRPTTTTNCICPDPKYTLASTIDIFFLLRGSKPQTDLSISVPGVSRFVLFPISSPNHGVLWQLLAHLRDSLSIICHHQSAVVQRRTGQIQSQQNKILYQVFTMSQTDISIPCFCTRFSTL